MKGSDLKKYLSLLFISFLFSAHIYGQSPASAVWNLTDSQTPVVSGSVTASNQQLTNMQALYVSSVQRSSPGGTAGTWPAESAENTSRYMQFSVSPTPGNLFSVSTISMILYSSAGSSMKANVYYSKDSSFANRTQIGTTFNLSNTAPSSPNVTVSPDLTVNSGETVYIRVYAWYASATTTKYLIAKTVTVSGSANSVTSVITSLKELTGFLQVSAAPSELKTYTVSGTNLTDNVLITPPADFEISTDAGTSWNGSSSPVTLNVSAGVITGQPVTLSVRMHSSSAGTYTESITHSSAGASVNSVSLTGIMLANEPTAASSLSFSNVTGSSMTLNFTGGNGSMKIVVVKAAGAVNWLPTDGQAVTGVNAVFSSAADQGNGNKVVFDGSETSVNLSGLNSNVTYYFAVYEYNAGSGNSQNYLTSAFASGNQATQIISSLSADPDNISFGSAVMNKDTVVKSYALSGKYLTSGGKITVAAPSGFEVSLSASSGYASSIELPYSGETINSTTIYVRFFPASASDYSGNVINSGGGASDIKVAVNGKGITAFVETNAPVGFASLGGGTTGGLGGSTVTITDAQQLADILRLRENKINTPLIVYISGNISGFSTELSVKYTSNISILGLGKDAGFTGFGMKIVDAGNIIVRNMHFSDCHVDEKDGIAVDGSSNVWIDHCTFTDSPGDDPSGGSHDGQLDVKNSAFNVTLSYNHFMNHRKTCLLGHTPGQTSDTTMKVTYYRNWFEGTYSRHPRIRFAKAHILNNLYTNVGVGGGYGVGITCNAQVLVESNYFEGTPTPILISQVNDAGETLSGDPTGYVKSLNNYLSGSGVIVENLGSFNFDPHNYYNYSAADAPLVKDLVKENAGAGIIDILSSLKKENSVVPKSLTLSPNYPNPFNPSTSLSFTVEQKGTASLKVYDVLGKEVAILYTGQAEPGKQYKVQFNAARLTSGIYFSVLQSGGRQLINKMVLNK